jgi:hypothetical protein
MLGMPQSEKIRSQALVEKSTDMTILILFTEFVAHEKRNRWRPLALKTPLPSL